MTAAETRVFPGNGRYLTPADSPHAQGRSVTFCLTHACNLACTYCYVHHKSSQEDMSKDLAAAVVDYMYLNREHSLAPVSPENDLLLFEFTGGEPLLRMDLVEMISRRILARHVESGARNSILFHIGSNGVAYLSPQVQKYLDDFAGLALAGLTIDGTREMHDACRVFPSRKGSFDVVVEAVRHCRSRFPEYHPKVTISPQNISDLSSGLIYLWEELGFSYVPANVVFEDVWTRDLERVFERELGVLISFLTTDRHYLRFATSLFDEMIGYPLQPEDTENTCGGDGRMVYWDTDGVYYNCARYAPSSSVNRSGFPLGDWSTGVNDAQLQKLRQITRRSCSDDECYYCDVASGCNYCPGAQWDFYGDPK